MRGMIERRDAGNLAYVFEDSAPFFPTGYKVLLSQAEKGFVRCARILHNGKDKLLYDIAEYKTLASLLPALRPEQYIMIVRGLLESVLEVKSNGFMNRWC